MQIQGNNSLSIFGTIPDTMRELVGENQFYIADMVISFATANTMPIFTKREIILSTKLD